MRDQDRREAIAEEIATKLYDNKNVKDIRQLIDGHKTRWYYDRFSDKILLLYMGLWDLSIKNSFEKLKQLGLQ